MRFIYYTNCPGRMPVRFSHDHWGRKGSSIKRFDCTREAWYGILQH